MESDSISGVAQRLVAYIRRPEFKDALLFGRKLLPLAARQRAEYRLVMLPARLGPPVSYPPTYAGRDVEVLIDNGEVAASVAVYGSFRSSST